LKVRIIKILKRIKIRVHTLFIGKEFLDQQSKMEDQIEFMSSIIAEQSRLIASIALVQSDMAATMKEKGFSESDGEYLTLKIPMPSDGPPN